jgi:Protein of unknown function (DUF3999)
MNFPYRFGSKTTQFRRGVIDIALLLAGAIFTTACLAQSAGPMDGYAYRWPLKTDGNNVAWQFELTPEVYAALRDPKLRDFEVFNAEGRAVPVAPLNQTAQISPQMQWAWLPTFALPREQAVGGNIGLRIERDSNGQLRMLDAQVQGATPATTTDGAVGAAAAIDYVIDASGIKRESRTATIDRLDLQWPYGDRDTRARFAVDASDDLENWQPLVEAAAIVSLKQQNATLQRRTIALPATAQPYLRLRQLDGDALPSLQIQARRLDPTTSMYAGFITRTAVATYVDSGDAEQGARWYRYRLPAALPVTHLGIVLASENATAEFDVQALVGEQWTSVGRQTVFRLRQGDLTIDNDDYMLGMATTAREWRLSSVAPLDTPPSIKVTYLPDRFVFLAQGKGPYTLAAGSRSAQRTPLPVEQALAPMRTHFGADWQPPTASLGARAAAGGDAAYDAPKTPPNWRGWLLWVLLIGGALIVAGFAMSLIRQPPAVGGK